jgi:hypothetical protein
MFPHFPLDLCVLALERARDDMSLAATWLIENGYGELDRLANETLQATAQSEARRQEQWMQTLLTSSGGGAGAAGERRAAASSGAAAEAAVRAVRDTSTLLTFGDPAGGDEDGGDASSRSAARLLDDELTNDAPLGFDPGRRADRGRGRDDDRDGVPLNDGSRDAADPLHDIALGAVLRVGVSAPSTRRSRPAWRPELRAFVGESGLVVARDIDAQAVRLAFVSAERTVRAEQWFHWSVLDRPLALRPEPCADVVKSGVSWARVAAALLEVETALAVLRVRRAVLALVATLPRCRSRPARARAPSASSACSSWPRPSSSPSRRRRASIRTRRRPGCTRCSTACGASCCCCSSTIACRRPAP